MKHILVLFTIILALIPVVKAEEKSWYEIDGIRFRPVNDSQNHMVICMPWKIEDRISPYSSDPPITGAIASNMLTNTYAHEKTTLPPFALELP